MQRKTTYGLLSLGLGALAATAVYLEKTSSYAATKHIRADAPVQTHQRIAIAAPPERVWQLMSDVDAWTSWQPDIVAPHLYGPFQVGTDFSWKSGGLTIRSTLHTVDVNRAIGWSGPALGSFAIHTWTFELQTDGTTEVRVDESMEGWLVRLLKPVFQRALDKSIQVWLARLKQAAEQPAGAEAY